ncbi:hypothetical protein ABZT03_12120 [Streptomyces sp. NPDC005574]|uniref:hypothetical protein n=1 Tax=Streptomyces sp. NPDC005574 TaxID=3156891 RepID=UPI0033A5978F
MKWENVVRIPTGTVVTACVLSAVLLLAGCGGASGQGANAGGQDAKPGGALRLAPAAAHGPESGPDVGPDSGSESGPHVGPDSGLGATTAVPSPVTRTPQPPAAPSDAPCAAPDTALAPVPGASDTRPPTAPVTRDLRSGLVPAPATGDGTAENASLGDPAGEGTIPADDLTGIDLTGIDTAVDSTGTGTAVDDTAVGGTPGDEAAACEPDSPLGLSDEIGPDRVPEIPDLRDGGGLIPDADPVAGDGVSDSPADPSEG